MASFSEMVIILSLLTFGVSKSNSDHSIDKSNKFATRKLLAVNRWCSLTCGTEELENIACSMGGACDVLKPCILEEIDKNLIIETHNDLRDKFASGSEPLMSGLEISNMMAVHWDDKLAFTAQCNLANCTGMVRDQCRTTPKFTKHVGQNIWSFGISTLGGDCIGEAVGGVQQWYEEVSRAGEEEIKGNAISYQAITHNIGHFTQLVWAETTHVGCALTKNEDSGITICIMTCNYGPGGNVVGDSMFKHGKPCTQCPGETKCSSVYDSLCDEIKRSAADRLPNIDLKILFVLPLYIRLIFMQ